jgi:hypothetical protein
MDTYRAAYKKFGKKHSYPNKWYLYPTNSVKKHPISPKQMLIFTNPGLSWGSHTRILSLENERLAENYDNNDQNRQTIYSSFLSFDPYVLLSITKKQQHNA